MTILKVEFSLSFIVTFESEKLMSLMVQTMVCIATENTCSPEFRGETG